MALITAVLAVAVAVSIAVALNYQAYLGIRRTQNVVAAGQARLYARAAEAVAIELLVQDRADNDIDSTEDVWADDLPPISLEDGATIRLEITDLQGRFNINNVAAGDEQSQESARAQLARLLALANPEYATGLEVAVADWVDADTDIRFPDGAEDDVYTRKDPPYRPGNTLMVDTSELRLVSGMDKETWRGLRGLVTALPDTGTAINVNTAPEAVLASLLPDADPAAAAEAVAERTEEPWQSVSAFLAGHPDFQQPEGEAPTLTVRSEYFLVHGLARLDRARVDLYTVLRRPADGGIRVIYRARTRP